MPRQALLRVDALLRQKHPGMTRVDLAKALDIGYPKLTGVLEGRWTVLDRFLLEKLADFLEADIGDLFATTESAFFHPFRVVAGNESYPGEPTCLYVRRPDADRMGRSRPIRYRDDEAIQLVQRLLDRWLEGIRPVEETASTSDEFDQCIQQNCVVIGAPRVNIASELALCRAFNVKPFDPASRQSMPFQFRWPPAAKGAEKSSIGENAASSASCGVLIGEERAFIKADYWDYEQFKRERIDRGRDCGIVLVMNHQSVLGMTRKLIVLAGFTGTGTQAAATALVDYYRDLEPYEDEGCVWGAIEVLYQKSAGSTDRQIRDYSWRCRFGGRAPIDFDRRRGPMQGRGGARRPPRSAELPLRDSSSKANP
jgi:hypothetical protein